MNLKTFLDPKMQDKIALLPPEALKYLLSQLQHQNAAFLDRAQVLKVVKIATNALDKFGNGKKQSVNSKNLNIKRFFFLPFKKIMFEGVVKESQVGRVSQNSLEKTWNYVSGHLLQDDVYGFESALRNAMLNTEIKRAKTIINEFNRLAGQRLSEVIEECSKSDIETRRLAMMMGGDVILDDAKQLCFYLQNLNEMERAIRFFSTQIVDFSGDKLKKITEEIIAVKTKNSNFLPLYVSLLINALKYPEHALRIIQRCYKIDDATNASTSGLKIIGELLIFNANVSATAFCNLGDENTGEKLHNFLKYASLILGMEREFNISPLSSWGQEIVKMRELVSIQLTKDIVNAPNLLKISLGRYQEAKQAGLIKAIDAYEINMLIAKMTILHGIKGHVAASICNTVFNDTYKGTIELINKMSDDIVGHIRKETPENKAILMGYLEAAKKLIIIIKDQQQAEVYYKGGMLAMRDELIQ